MKRLGYIVGFCFLAGFVALADWASRSTSYTATGASKLVAFTNSTLSNFRITGITCYYNKSSTGAVQIVRLRSSKPVVLLAQSYSGITNQSFTLEEFDGVNIIPSDILRVYDSCPATSTNTIIVDMESEK